MKRHFFVAVNPVNWEYPALVETWRQLGRVTHFQNPTGIDQWDDNWMEQGRPAFNKALLKAVQTAHEAEPISLFFSYLSGRWVSEQTLEQIRKWGIKLVNISFDDTVHFRGGRNKEGWDGNASIAPLFDLCVTCQNPGDVWKYRFKRARALFLPPGAPNEFADLEGETSPVPALCFVGQNYGVRGELVSQLATRFPLRSYGKGWPSGPLTRAQMGEIYRNSLINLGFGFIGESRHKLGLKGRDFEVTAAGGFYLTTYHPVLARYFGEGKEIEFYRNDQELEQKARFYLDHPEKAIAIGQAAQQRVRREHLWVMRFQTISEHVLGTSVPGK